MYKELGAKSLVYIGGPHLAPTLGLGKIMLEL